MSIYIDAAVCWSRLLIVYKTLCTNWCVSQDDGNILTVYFDNLGS